VLRKPAFAAANLILSTGFVRAQVYDITTGRPNDSGFNLGLYPDYV
jgi:hypothetical protein